MQCPNCQSQLPDYAKVCGMCGHRLTQPAGKAPEPFVKSPAEPIEEHSQPESEVQASPQPTRIFDWKIYSGMLITTVVGVILFTRLPMDFFLGLNFQLGNGSFAGGADAGLLGLIIACLHWLVWRKQTGLRAVWMVLLPAAFFLDQFFWVEFRSGGLVGWSIGGLLIAGLLSLANRKDTTSRRVVILFTATAAVMAAYSLHLILLSLLEPTVSSLPYSLALALSPSLALFAGGVIMPLFLARKSPA